MKVFLALLVLGVLATACVAEEEPEHVAPSREIELSELKELLSTEEGIESLYTEFESIKGGERNPWTVSALPENIGKSRYDDLLAFDHSRVVLDPLPDDPHTDLINANYIDGINSEKEYVATQGPLPNTIYDFWRMIWQLDAKKIVMLANLYEHGKPKVAKYWPDNKVTYGEDIEVRKIYEFNVTNLQHIVRTFTIRKVGTSETRIVRQFHFTGWPDLGVPQNRQQVLAIMREARQYKPDSKAPIVIHCSAGIGRTGTIILLDSMIQRAFKEGKVNFPQRLDHMRQLRPDVVEKKEQYVFAHEAVNDLFNVPETQEFLQHVDEAYHNLDKDSEDLVPPKDLHEGLRRMKWQNTVMNMLIHSMEENVNEHEIWNGVNEISDQGENK